ncbi:substrate-binding periplasmic protein [Catenovulum sediminis]|uniref:substrate-binding periplasmic protein n=1 Tax=Catenovulum sediminis TaxID=1740262 RepID=UPI001180D8AB|nr:transporter substrate-binding domain-containing protein [Catenovulum sediminis]
MNIGQNLSLKSILVVCLLIFAALPKLGFATTTESHLKFVVPHFPPYTFIENGTWHGEGYKMATEALKQAKIAFTIKPVSNYGKAFAMLKSGHADGFFLASQNEQRDKIAVFSQSIVTNHWKWYVLKDIKDSPYSKYFKDNYRIASHLNANTHIWLKENGYRVEAVVDVASIALMLEKNRFEAVLLAEKVFEQTALQQNISLASFNQYLHSNREFGIYISKKKVHQNPEIMRRLNQAILQIQTKHINQNSLSQ